MNSPWSVRTSSYLLQLLVTRRLPALVRNHPSLRRLTRLLSGTASGFLRYAELLFHGRASLSSEAYNFRSQLRAVCVSEVNSCLCWSAATPAAMILFTCSHLTRFILYFSFLA